MIVTARRLLPSLACAVVAALAPAPGSAQFFSGFTLSGEMGTFGELYGSYGREPRRPGSTGRLFFRPTLSLTEHLKLSFDILLSTEGTDARTGAASPTLSSARQRVNQLGISPTWSWGKVHLGDFTDTYTPFTFSGVRVRGAGAALKPGILRFGVFGGQAQTAVIGGATNGSYARDIVGGRIGLGRDEGSFFDLIFVRASDDETSLPLADDTAFVDPRQDDPTVDADTLPVGTLVNPLSVTPQENVVVAATGRLTLLDKKLELRGEVSGSAYSRDVRASAIDNDAVLDEFPGFLRSLFTPRLSSTFGLAYTVAADVRLPTLSGTARYQSVAPGYMALGVASLLNDQRAWDLSATRRFGRRASLRLDAARQHDNLVHQKATTTTRDRYGAMITVRPQPRWTAALRVTFVGMHNDAPASDAAWISYDNWILATNHTVSLGRDRLLRSVGGGYTYRKAGDDNPARGASSLTAHTLNVRAVLAPSRTLSVTPSLGLARTWPAGAPAWRTRATYGLAAQLRALEGKWTTSASLGASQQGSVGVLQSRITSRYNLTQADALTFTLRGSSYANAPNPVGAGGDFQELTVSLQVTHRFGGNSGSPGVTAP